MNRRAIIVALAGLNLLLAGVLILMAFELPKAQAQGIGRAGNYLMVAGEIQDGLDALYIMNLDQQILDVILLNKQGNRPEIVGRRQGPDVVSDLRQRQVPGVPPAAPGAPVRRMPPRR